MQSLTVLYDSSCPLCQWAARWLWSKPKLVPMRFVPAGSEQARAEFPGLDHDATSESVTVVGDDGSVYTNEKAWVMCLWCLRGYRGIAKRLSTPSMLPLAAKFVKTVSKYRPHDGRVGECASESCRRS